MRLVLRGLIPAQAIPRAPAHQDDGSAFNRASDSVWHLDLDI